ncbi:DUF1902 domain-containing protein [Afifella sp. IM 167]|uniref:DUF1902 domain-containing protein n=1 Tax=Afifella sp. IM 167 TaxID=2033586 RepID=UPI001CCD2B60|nr:DUF1902 domain-containing protein [Afifella sp. IM 167]MBZ8132921.1 hypothetical protein [Afifella sp. IM 167]
MTESSTNAIEVTADWDAEAKVWVAVSEDVPGLVVEARSVDTLVAEIEALIPQLLKANGHHVEAQARIEYHLTAHVRSSLSAAA